MKIFYTSVFVVITLMSSCKLKEDQQAGQGKAMPDNSSAINPKASNDAAGWEKINTTGGGGAVTGSLGKQMDAINNTDAQNRFLADSIDRAYQVNKIRYEDSMRKVQEIQQRQSIAMNTRQAATKESITRRAVERSSGAGSPSPKKAVQKIPEEKIKVQADPVVDQSGSDLVDDFNTVVFSKKSKGSEKPSAAAAEEKKYTGKERFDEIDVSIPAVVKEKTSVTMGGALSVRTTKAQYIGQGITLPAGSVVTGFADIQDDRLNLTIRSVNYNGRILRLSWKVYDNDGAEGMAVSNATLQKNGSTGVNQTMSTAGQLITGNGVIGQLTGGLVRNVMSGSGKISITVPAGKKLIIKSAN